jgi:flagellar biosynthesis/type III secretory pathway chaperone
MIDSIQRLIVALREELQEYGEMLALLDRQQQMIMARAADEVFQSISIIQVQGAAIQNARLHREQRHRDAAEDHGQVASTPFAVLIPLLPSDYRPLVKALVDENNELLVRVQQRARQNHLLLNRSLELMQGLLNSLLPSRETGVYNDHGAAQVALSAPRSFYEAVG